MILALMCTCVFLTGCVCVRVCVSPASVRPSTCHSVCLIVHQARVIMYSVLYRLVAHEVLLIWRTISMEKII